MRWLDVPFDGVLVFFALVGLRVDLLCFLGFLDLGGVGRFGGGITGVSLST